ncbi:hypothetical protein SAMN05216311_110326 [Chitinophaga sp. CF418]|nr:hypothetical protein SAMN05216311_110326 [Chitinophaga sp. CF418]
MRLFLITTLTILTYNCFAQVGKVKVSYYNDKVDIVKFEQCWDDKLEMEIILSERI